jgi:hypothetical protein
MFHKHEAPRAHRQQLSLEQEERIIGQFACENVRNYTAVIWFREMAFT